jgi:hypothetical protein
VAFARVDVTFEGAVPEGTTLDAVRVIETDAKGIPYASDGLDGERTGSVVFMPHPQDPEDVEFAAVVWGDGNRVLGLEPIGRAAPGTVTEATVSLGEGRELCVDLYDEETCHDPAE